MRIHYRGHTLDLRLTQETLTVRGRKRGVGPIRLALDDAEHEFDGGTRVFQLDGKRRAEDPDETGAELLL